MSAFLVAIFYEWVCWMFGCYCRGFSHHDDDFIFEDFARLRLTGHAADDTEAWRDSAVTTLPFFATVTLIAPGVQPVCARIF